jgi:5-methyltetrahydropteroyltriglutamate--homocysteine methyltransferase
MGLNRIQTTHAGALPRSEGLTNLIRGRAAGGAADDAFLEHTLSAAVAEAVRLQLACGLDSINDGELSKSNFMHYVTERVSSIEVREYALGQGPTPLSITARDKKKFPDYFAGGRGGFASGGKETTRPTIRQHVCVGPLRYVGQNRVQADIKRFSAALAGSPSERQFLPSVALGVLEHWVTNEYYGSQQEFLYAIADMMREEYLAIINAGFMLQIDDPDLADGWQMYPDMSIADYRKYAMLRIEALNHSLRGIPREKIRVHVCWGSYHGPHEFDLPLKEIVDVLFRVNAREFSIEAANPRHEHEWQVFEDFRLPDDTVLIPGVVGHCTDFIEHPELVAQRLVRYANLVGGENLMAGTDCGLGNRTATPSIAWAKLKSLVEGAQIASRTIWPSAAAAPARSTASS